jgi:predicted DsbA family dithiol-disulfide isomerase
MENAIARAKEEFPLVSFTTIWHPYFLDVTLESKGLSKRDNYRAKGMSESALNRMEKSMAQNFAGEGIVYSLDGDTGNTVDSHRLAAWTYTKFGPDAQDSLIEVMFRKFFGQQMHEDGGGNPASHEMLLAALAEAVVGVDLDEAAEFLAGTAGRQHVLENAHALMTQESVTGVPHYFVTVDGSQTPDMPSGIAYQVPGAQDTETFYLVLRQLVVKTQEKAALPRL